MIFNTALEYVNHALLLAKDRCARNSQFPVYTSVINQLIYVKAVFEGVEKDKSRLHDLSLGALGAKKFEDMDYELARAIMDVSYIASQSANGLKVKLPTGILYQEPPVR
ncbi:immunity protein Tsi6 family protein [Pseudomonas savastanoi]|uniref:immunity protein Tsi6 family protein n=1 Tax=Pseudomonas savastanoi TaxID=29438 RepID=UPI0004E141DB|nr:immunity protein Tsi6 family protein [Pseudomonas savastanoi]